MVICKTFLIATVQDRIDGLIALLLSSQKYAKSWEYVIVAQSYGDADKECVEGVLRKLGIRAHMIYVDTGIGPGRAKRLGISEYKSNIWVSLDDDMEMLPATDYDKMADILEGRKDIGFLSGNWAKTRGQAEAKRLQDKLVKQDIVYTGGGMMFRNDVAEMLLETMPDEPWLFDNVAWSLASYVAGYDNYRYLGSVAVHKVCTVGGRKKWVRQGKRVLPDETLIRVRPAFNDKAEAEVGNCFCICDSKDLTDKAKTMHEDAKRQRFHKDTRAKKK